MAVRKIVKYGEPSLREPSKEVHKVSKKIADLVQDLFDTMYTFNGVGLAAPQIGINLRVYVIDASTKNNPMKPMVFINQKIIKKSGAYSYAIPFLAFARTRGNSSDSHDHRGSEKQIFHNKHATHQCARPFYRL